MAITAVAAFAGAAGAAAGYATIVAAAAAVVTVVGIATKSSSLMKIGAGLGVGGAVAGAAGWTLTAGSAANGGAAGSAVAEGAATEAAASTASEAAATGASANSTGTTLRALEGGSNAAYGSEAIAGSAVPTAVDGSRVRTVGSGYGESGSSGIIDAAADTSAVSQPAAVSKVADVASVAQPASVNSTGTTLRAMEGGTNAVYNGSSANGGSSYWESIGNVWKGLDSGDKQIVGGIIKGVGQGAASYIGESMKTQSQIDAENRLRDNRSNFTPVTWRTK
mgnify:CR=1 FL=1